MSSSSSLDFSRPYPKNGYYDVFISFGGKDKHNKRFTDNIYCSLLKNKVYTFMNVDHVGDALFEIIGRSRMAVIVYSESFASSYCCLSELEMILQHVNSKEKQMLIIPVFYNVDLHELKLMTGKTAMYLDKHIEEHGEATVMKWKNDVITLGNITGLSYKDANNRSEYDFITDVIAKIKKNLKERDETLDGSSKLYSSGPTTEQDKLDKKKESTGNQQAHVLANEEDTQELAVKTDVEDKRFTAKENIGKGSNPSKETQSSQRTTTATTICEEVGFAKIVGLLGSEDVDVQIHAVKVVANLAAADDQYERIVEEGGLDAVLMLLRSSENTTVVRVACGAIANLAMDEATQVLIMSKQGGQLLAETATKTDDPQTLRMVAGGIANLCGNQKLHLMLKQGGCIKALLEMARSRNVDVIVQMARGISNFAKCESRAILKGQRKGGSLLMEDGVHLWLISNSNSNSAATTASIRHYIQLALCHLAQNEDNARDLISSGGLKELRKISNESSKEDIRNLANNTLTQLPIYRIEELKQRSI